MRLKTKRSKSCKRHERRILMKIFKNVAKTPEENLALDEVLLSMSEQEKIGSTLRFWESSEYFVVLGRACKFEKEVNLPAFKKDNIKVLRRISGGGTVLQGPGCLNYSLILPYGEDQAYRKVSDSYVAVSEKVLSAIGRSLVLGLRSSNTETPTPKPQHLKPKCSLKGLSDLVSDGRKFSGNAQARKKNYFLHHGTILHNFDLTKIPVYLKHPPKEPDYRKGRPHKDFIKNINIDIEALKKFIATEFNAKTELETSSNLIQEINNLATNKYSSTTWNFSF